MIVKSEAELKQLAWEFGRNLVGGECIELRGDVGVGKTVFAQGLAEGIGVTSAVSSPSYTIEKSYLGKNNLVLDHYDFYRLEKPGLMRRVVEESLMKEKHVTVVEWAQTVAHVLPHERIIVEVKYVPDQPEWREVNYVPSS